jgi:hypothetical protein
MGQAAIHSLKMARVPLVSALLLFPCFWHSRIHAGDLSSHVYNAWLVQLVRQGVVQGLHIADRKTNVLFDLILESLLRAVGVDWAQRLSVSVCVLVFCWGAFAFCSAVAGRRPWHVMPLIALLAYGFVFHMGFFNFYMATGLSLLALALAWSARRRWLAIPVFLAAAAAHVGAVLGIFALLAYGEICRRLPAPRRTWLLAGGVAGLAALGLALAKNFEVLWSPRQLFLVTGADQLIVFGTKYRILPFLLIAAWTAMVLKTAVRRQYSRDLSALAAHFAALTAAAVVLLPQSVFLLQGVHSLSYVSERLSFFLALWLCALCAEARPSRGEIALTATISLVFFSFLYVDTRALDRFEDRMRQAVAGIPARQRVTCNLVDPEPRVPVLAHVIDRACVGHCFSYANYEPSTRQFRLVAQPDNGVVLGAYEDVWAFQTGAYTVRERDLPLYAIAPQGASLRAVPLKLNQRSSPEMIRVLPALLQAGERKD